MAFVLVYLGIGVIAAYAMLRFDQLQEALDGLTKNAEEFDELMVRMLNRNEQQQQEINELKAYVVLLESNINHLCITCTNVEKPCNRTAKGFSTSACSDYVKITPSQSLNHIKAQVEEETIAIKRKYNELLMAVQTKFADETRHETALRYIMQAENTEGNSTQIQEQSDEGGE